jgi:hypothetical protein
MPSGGDARRQGAVGAPAMVVLAGSSRFICLRATKSPNKRNSHSLLERRDIMRRYGVPSRPASHKYTKTTVAPRGKVPEAAGGASGRRSGA